MTLDSIREEWTEAQASGEWVPPKGDPLFECPFSKAGFRSWELAAADKTWRLVLSRVHFTSSDPRALLTVFAPGHDAAFGDLDGHVFNREVGVNGRNLGTTAKELHQTLGGSPEDWRRRLDYLMARTVRDNAGRNNGTYQIVGKAERPTAPPYIFRNRIRVGRTMSLFGPGSAGKTTIGTGLLISLAAGGEILPDWKPTRKYRVLTLDWDEGREEDQVRVFAICNAYNISLDGYHFKRMKAPLAEVADEVGRYVVENQIEVIMISPVERALRQGDRQSGPAAPVEEMYEVLSEFGTTNILIDHVRGDQVSGNADREYGSVRKRDNARGAYSVYQQSEEPGKRVIVLRNKKPDALAPRQGPQAIRIEFDPPWPDENGAYDSITFHPDEVRDSAGEIIPIRGSGEPQWKLMARILREYGDQDVTGLTSLSGLHAARLKDIAREARKHDLNIYSEEGIWKLGGEDEF